MVMNIVQRTASNPVAWFLYRACGRLSNYLGQINANAQFARQIANRDENRAKLVVELFPDLAVANGPFKGLRYLSTQAFWERALP
jgi:hypothetical protein